MPQLDEQTIRLTIFISVLIACASIEAIFPRKQRTQSRFPRWLTNISIIAIDSIAIRLMGQVTAISAAAYASTNGWGVFNFIDLPLWLEIVLAVALLDLAVYAQHVVSHNIPFLWRFHRVHHADRDIDVTTGSRFHPIEIVLSMLYKCIIVLLIGPTVFAVFLFEIILNASAMFNHTNMKLPLSVDKVLRMLCVTPDMHRVHHSTIPKETNSNYGFFLSIWDRFFGTYIPQPKEGHDGMVIGLDEYQSNRPSHIFWCLKLPFQK